MDLDSNGILSIPHSAFVFVSMFLNLLILFLIFKYLINANKSYIWLITLLCVNSIAINVGIILPVFKGFFFDQHRGFHYKFECFLTTSLTAFSALLEHLIILFLSIDLLLAFRYPMDYLTKRFNKLPIVAAIVSITAGILAVYMNTINFDFREQVKICAIDEISGNVGKLYSAAFMFIILICNIVLWIIAFITIMKDQSSSTVTLRLQHELFVVFTYIVIAYAFKTIAPICFYMVSIFFSFDSDLLNIGTSMLALFVVLTTSIFNALILLLKNSDINKSLKKLLKKKQIKKHSIHIISAQVHSSHV